MCPWRRCWQLCGGADPPDVRLPVSDRPVHRRTVLDELWPTCLQRFVAQFAHMDRHRYRGGEMCAEDAVAVLGQSCGVAGVWRALLPSPGGGIAERDAV